MFDKTELWFFLERVMLGRLKKKLGERGEKYLLVLHTYTVLKRWREKQGV